MKSYMMLFTVFTLLITTSMNGMTTDWPVPKTEEGKCETVLAEEPKFNVRLCFNALFVSVCVVLECQLHWSDALVPSIGQLFGEEYGCELQGNISVDTNHTPTSFQGGSEDMIQAIESALQVPVGSLTELRVDLSPEFELPDGKRYQVVSKTYPIEKGAGGRYIPLEVKLVNRIK